MTLATAFISIGFELVIFGLGTAPTLAFENSSHAVESLEIIGFLCLLVAFVLIMFMQYGGLKSKKVAAAMVIVTSFLGGEVKLSQFNKKGFDQK